MVEPSIPTSNTSPKRPVVVSRIGLFFLGVTLLYIALVIAPFYGNGIHLYDPEPFSQYFASGYPPFSWFSWGRELRLGTVFVYLGGIVSGVPLLISLFALLLTRLRTVTFSRWEWGIWSATTLLYSAAMWLTWLHWDAIRLWILD
jgi:hypothetical protein